MALVSDKDKKQLLKAFERLEHEVRILFFSQETECQFCQLTRELLEEITKLSPKLSLAVYDFVRDKEMVERYGIARIPATVVQGDQDMRIRVYGIPAGFEFTALIEDILDVSRRSPNLPKPVLDELASITQPVHLQVMVSPTCPYCPAAVRAAHRLAMASPNIRADMVEVTEFPHLAVKYNVQGVPVTIINETANAMGALSELELVRQIRQALDQPAPVSDPLAPLPASTPPVKN